MSEKKVSAQDLNKALSVFEDLAKGHSSKGTPATAVESMTSQGGPTQVFHTPSNSDPGSWAGSVARDVPENGASDSIDANGTDYNGGAKMAKSILSKMSKGQTLSAHEVDFVSKGGMDYLKDKKDVEKGVNPFAKKDDDEDGDKDAKMNKGENPFAKKDDDDEDEKVAKSLLDITQDSDEIQKGFEMSTFLVDFVESVQKSLENMEQRINRNTRATVAQHAAEQAQFQKSFAGSMSALGAWLTQTDQRVESVESAPARGPKSVTHIEKSFGEDAEQLSKSQVADTLVDLVVKGQATREDVLRFDSSNRISPDLMNKVRSFRSGK
jgi:hypothetical protein